MDGSYDDDYDSGVVESTAPNWKYLIHSGVISGHVGPPTEKLYACCTVEDIDDGPDDLKVKLRNFLQYEVWNVFGEPIYDDWQYSDTRIVTVWVKKIPAP